MKFEFKPTDNIKDFREYLSFFNRILSSVIIYKKAIYPIAILSVFYFATLSLSQFYDIFIYIVIITMVVILIYYLLFLLAFKVFKNKKNKVLKNTALFCDLESTFFFTIEDNYLIRENEFSTIKLHLSNIESIILLKNGLVLSIAKGNNSIFIPIAVLPVSLKEFISLIKDINPSLMVFEEFTRLKKLKKKTYISFALMLILTFVTSFFIGKYNFKRYDLILTSDLIKQNSTNFASGDNSSYIYENPTLGFSLALPGKWEGKVGIEEKSDRVNIYYLANGKQSHDTTLLFSVRGLDVFFNTIDFYIIKSEGLYLFVGPTKIGLKRGSKKLLEYQELYNDIKNIKLYRNTYHQG
ncbi:hypothetical protein H9660_06055 [Clostridium sp. Sa3CUN1]|uniref:YcxB-like protein domain-containing protein n=1 Tax=Clostridium gallinarum TaxID=2762246 RepID=A0ABR8Q2P5_9CLOT|nr:hypothetical protein [Clostridium gallinarum]MBD7914703.1 hypothetical protein [Clostridium gallinarum]